jgi:hypothetical protein
MFSNSSRLFNRKKRKPLLNLFLSKPFREEIFTLVVNDNERRKVFNLDLPNGLHT